MKALSVMRKMNLQSIVSLSVIILALAVCCPAAARAQDVEAEKALMKKQVSEKMLEILNGPPGVFDEEYDENKELIRVKIKGEGEVSTALSGAKADRKAREQAERNAKAAFTRYLGENFTIAMDASEITSIKEKNRQQEAEDLGTSAEMQSSHASELLRGVSYLLTHVEGEGEYRVYTVVLGWSRKQNEAALRARSEMQRTSPKSANSEEKQPEAQAMAPEEQTAPAKGNSETRTRSASDLENF